MEVPSYECMSRCIKEELSTSQPGSPQPMAWNSRAVPSKVSHRLSTKRGPGQGWTIKDALLVLPCQLNLIVVAKKLDHESNMDKGRSCRRRLKRRSTPRFAGYDEEYSPRVSLQSFSSSCKFLLFCQFS